MPPLRWPRLFAVILILGMTAATVAWLVTRRLRTPIASSAALPATLPSQPDTAPSPATQPAVANYMDIIRHRYPDFPATRPFDIPAEISEAGHILIDNPVYVCSRGDLWITDPNGPSIKQALTTTEIDTEHVIAERIAYVHWARNFPTLIVPGEKQGWDVVDLERRRPLPWRRPYHWDAALSWDDKIIVPTDHGVSIITVGRTLTEDYHALIDSPARHDPQVSFDSSGLLAWIPPDGKTRDGHVARYVDGHWTMLTGNEWEPRPVHLVPLLDGSLLQFAARPDGTLNIEPITLEAAPFDAAKVDDLIDQLGDDDPDKRAAAFAQLSEYGPGIWPRLEMHVNDPEPDISSRIHALLQAKLKPTLGGMSIVADDLRLANRFPGGGVVMYAPGGVLAPFGGPDQSPITVQPAWLSLAPGEPAELLPQPMTSGLDPTRTQLLRIRDEWIALDVDGARRFLSPSSYLPILRNSEKDFSHLLTIDRRGRWLFQRPNSPDQTLIIDPNLPDPAPRLMVWLPDPTGSAGWDHNNWPVMSEKDKFWLLNETDWVPVDAVHDAVQTRLPAPTTTTSPRVLLKDSKGNTYYDGLTQLIRVASDGSRIQWPLPPSAAAPDGTSPASVCLIETHGGLLYLFNASSRAVRLRPTTDGPAPFRCEGTFTKGIPSADQIERIWLDPANRIDIVYQEFGKTRLAILFAGGPIPSELQRWILPRNLRINGPE